MSTMSSFVLPGILFLLTLAFGFWMSALGKPYSAALLNVHKLIALGAVVWAAVQLSRILRTVHPQALVVILLVVAALCVVTLFATGALLSAGKLEYALMRIVHGIATVFLVAATAGVMALLARLAAGL